MTVFWDTSLSPYNFPEEIKKIYFKESFLQRKKYTKWIGEISKSNRYSLDWWASNPTTRNPDHSKVFKLICIIETLKKLPNNKNFLIEVKNKAYEKTIINSLKKKKKKIKIRLNKSYYNNNIFSFIKSIVFNLLILMIVKNFIKKKILKKKNISLISTYTTLNSKYPERLYMLNNKNKKIDKKYFFVSTFLITNKIFKLWKIIKILEKKNYIFREHYLSIKDYFYSFSHFYRVRKLERKFILYNRYDLSPQINYELKSLSHSSSRIDCFLNYFFIKNLKKRKIEPKKFVVWFENQPDKISCLAINKYFPKSFSIGYQGFTDMPQYMNSIPTKYEQSSKLLPKKLVVIGRAYIGPRKEFYKNIKIFLGPAQVYQKALLEKKKIKKVNKFLIILSNVKEMNQTLLSIIIKNNKIFKNHKLLIKLPKGQSITDVKNLKSFPENFHFTNDNLQKLMKKTEIVICAEVTGAILECFIYNCYLLLPNINISNQIYIEKLGVPKSRFSTISNDFEFKNKIGKIKNKKMSLIYSQKLINNLFNKSTKKNIKLFF